MADFKCHYHYDCFGRNAKGFCQVLNDTTFKHDCSFYKTKKQVEEERKKYPYLPNEYKKFSKKALNLG